MPPSAGEHGGQTHLEIGHMVFQQRLSIADVLFSSHKNEGNHALRQTRRRVQCLCFFYENR